MSDRTIIDRLINIRKTRGLRQLDVAQRMNVTQSFVAKLESQRDIDMRLGELQAYAKAVDCALHIEVLPLPENTETPK